MFHCDPWFCSLVEAAPVEETSDWATLVQEEEWNTKHDSSKLDKKEAKVTEVTVATCSDDGTAQLWQPLLVSVRSRVKVNYVANTGKTLYMFTNSTISACSSW